MLPLLEGQTWTLVCPSARIAGNGDMWPFCTESKGWNILSTMVPTNLRTTDNLLGAARWMRRQTPQD